MNWDDKIINFQFLAVVVHLKGFGAIWLLKLNLACFFDPGGTRKPISEHFLMVFERFSKI